VLEEKKPDWVSLQFDVQAYISIPNGFEKKYSVKILPLWGWY